MSNDNKKSASCVRLYLKGVLLALLGRNPYREELDKAKAELAKAIEDVQLLKEKYAQLNTAFDKSRSLAARLEIQTSKVVNGLLNRE